MADDAEPLSFLKGLLLHREPSWARGISSESRVRSLKEDRDLVERAPSRVLCTSSRGSNFPAFAFTINAVLGAGIVSIPYAFAQVGLLSAVLILVFVTYVSALGMRWIVEASARADRLEGVSEGFEYATQRGVTELCGLFFGPRGSLAAEVSLVFYGVSSMFMYAAVFAETCAASLPTPFPAPPGTEGGCNYRQPLSGMPLGCRLTYWFWLTVFAILQARLAARNLSDQAASQLVLAALGMLSLALMLGTLVIAIFSEEYGGCRGEPAEEVGALVHTCPVALVLRSAGLSFAVSTLSSAQMAQFGTPVLASSCGNKQGAARVFALALTFTCVVYILYGSLGALYYGSAGVVPLITVLWRNYQLPWGGAIAARVGNIIGAFIAAYPAVTVSAAFPVNAVATGNALLWAWCDHEILDPDNGKARVVTGPRSPVRLLLCILPCCRRHLVRSCDVQGIRSDMLPAGSLFLSARRMQYTMRALVMLPAFLLAGLTSNLGTIIQVSALAGFVFAFMVPPLLQLASRRRCEEQFDGEWRTPYTLGLGSSKAMAWTCILFGLLAAVLGTWGAATGQS